MTSISTGGNDSAAKRGPVISVVFSKGKRNIQAHSSVITTTGGDDCSSVTNLIQLPVYMMCVGGSKARVDTISCI